MSYTTFSKLHSKSNTYFRAKNIASLKWSTLRFLTNILSASLSTFETNLVSTYK